MTGGVEFYEVGNLLLTKEEIALACLISNQNSISNGNAIYTLFHPSERTEQALDSLVLNGLIIRMRLGHRWLNSWVMELEAIEWLNSQEVQQQIAEIYNLCGS